MTIITRKTTLVWQIPYITHGLVAYWDGEWNIGGGIHAPAAMIWKDLVGGHDIAITPSAMGNFTWLGKGLRHVGPNFDIKPTFSMVDLVGGSTFTLSYVVNIERRNEMQRYIPFGFSSGDIGFKWGNTENVFVSMPWGIGNIYRTFDTLIDHDIALTASTDGTYHYGAIDGILFGQARSGDYQPILSKDLVLFNSIGQNPTIDDSWICTIRRILVYSRTITKEEDIFNHQVDIVRFH